MNPQDFPPGQEPRKPFVSKRPGLAELRAEHVRKAGRIRTAALAFFVIGAALSSIGAVSIFSTYAHVLESLDSLGADPQGMTPRYAWLLYVGIPFLVVSMVLRIKARLRRLGSF